MFVDGRSAEDDELSLLDSNSLVADPERVPGRQPDDSARFQTPIVPTVSSAGRSGATPEPQASRRISSVSDYSGRVECGQPSLSERATLPGTRLASTEPVRGVRDGSRVWVGPDVPVRRSGDERAPPALGYVVGPEILEKPETVQEMAIDLLAATPAN